MEKTDRLLSVLLCVGGIVFLLSAIYWFIVDGGPHSVPAWGFFISGLLLNNSVNTPGSQE